MTDSDWTPQEREESFGVIVFCIKNGNKEVLLVKTDHWGFPKGHAEGGEDGFVAAIREVKEETGISAEVPDMTQVLQEEYEIRREGFTTKKTVTYWVGKGQGTPTPQEGEIIEVGWFLVDNALKLLTHESARNILKSLL